MADNLCSVGLDVGTTSTQLIFSRLTVENQAGAFSVPDLQIAEREILYRSPVHFTPLLDENRVDGEALARIVAEEYARAGICREAVDTGAIIITGETSRKENAAAVLRELEGFAGEFVVATAGPDLESLLAAKGAGAVELSRETGKTVLHMDIGGGTSNLALIREGRVTATGCLNVGGRLLKFDEQGIVTYVSPVLEGLCGLQPGDSAMENQVEKVAEVLVTALEMAAGLRDPGPLLEQLTTKGTCFAPPEEVVTLSFSGGVADCIHRDIPWLRFGDMGPVLGMVIRRSRLCRGDFILGRETIRATVIGAGCHSTQLSGSTVFYRNVRFPLKNRPVVTVPGELLENGRLVSFLEGELRKQDTVPVIALPEVPLRCYEALRCLAENLSRLPGKEPLLICLEQDAAKALGQALALRTAPDREILCIDRINLREGSFLDVGAPIGPALPVVIKTLALGG